MSSKRVWIIGFPSNVGGAGTECWHTLQLWRRYGLDVALIPTWGPPPPCWRGRVERLGAPTVVVQPQQLHTVDRLADGIVVSWCNRNFLAYADVFRRLGCRIIWVGCMNWLFDEERRHYKRYGPFDVYVCQSEYQRMVIGQQLGRFGVRPEQLHLVRAAFMTEEWPFWPQPRRPEEPFAFGRLSRAAVDKFHRRTWEIYGQTADPKRVHVMGWTRELERSLGPPPAWAEVYRPGAMPAQGFFARLHAYCQLNGAAVENWPRSGLEAMAAGAPIVAPQRGGWVEMIEHGKTGFLAKTEDEIPRYLNTLAQDEALRLQMAEAARRRLVEELAPPETIWGRWKQVFQSVGVSE